MASRAIRVYSALFPLQDNGAAPTNSNLIEPGWFIRDKTERITVCPTQRHKVGSPAAISLRACSAINNWKSLSIHNVIALPTLDMTCRKTIPALTDWTSRGRCSSNIY